MQILRSHSRPTPWRGAQPNNLCFHKHPDDSLMFIKVWELLRCTVELRNIFLPRGLQPLFPSFQKVSPWFPLFTYFHGFKNETVRWRNDKMKFPWVLESVQTPFTQLYPFTQNLTRRLHTNIYPYKNFPLIFMFISKLSFFFQCSLQDCEQDPTGLYTQCELKKLWLINITIAAMIEYLLCCKHCAYNTCFYTSTTLWFYMTYLA